MSLATLFEMHERPYELIAYEKDDKYILEAIVAGVKADQVEISYEKGNLSIRAQSDRHQYSYFTPMEAIEIDETVAPEAILEDGILKIAFTKAKQHQPFKITVKQQ